MTDNKPVVWAPCESKVDMLARLTELYSLIDTYVPDDGHVDMLLPFHTIFLDRDSFVAMFKGMECEFNAEGTASIERYGFRWATLHFVGNTSEPTITRRIEA